MPELTDSFSEISIRDSSVRIAKQQHWEGSTIWGEGGSIKFLEISRNFLKFGVNNHDRLCFEIFLLFYRSQAGIE